MFIFMIDSLSEIHSDIFCISLPYVPYIWQVTSGVVEINMIGLYQAMIGRLRQLSEPSLRQQAGIGKSQTSEERDILFLRVTPSLFYF